MHTLYVDSLIAIVHMRVCCVQLILYNLMKLPETSGLGETQMAEQFTMGSGGKPQSKTPGNTNEQSTGNGQGFGSSNAVGQDSGMLIRGRTQRSIGSGRNSGAVGRVTQMTMEVLKELAAASESADFRAAVNEGRIRTIGLSGDELGLPCGYMAMTYTVRNDDGQVVSPYWLAAIGGSASRLPDRMTNSGTFGQPRVSHPGVLSDMYDAPYMEVVGPAIVARMPGLNPLPAVKVAIPASITEFGHEGKPTPAFVDCIVDGFCQLEYFISVARGFEVPMTIEKLAAGKSKLSISISPNPSGVSQPDACGVVVAEDFRIMVSEMTAPRSGIGGTSVVKEIGNLSVQVFLQPDNPTQAEIQNLNLPADHRMYMRPIIRATRLSVDNFQMEEWLLVMSAMSALVTNGTYRTKWTHAAAGSQSLRELSAIPRLCAACGVQSFRAVPQDVQIEPQQAQEALQMFVNPNPVMQFAVSRFGPNSVITSLLADYADAKPSAEIAVIRSWESLTGSSWDRGSKLFAVLDGGRVFQSGYVTSNSGERIPLPMSPLTFAAFCSSQNADQIANFFRLSLPESGTDSGLAETVQLLSQRFGAPCIENREIILAMVPKVSEGIRSALSSKGIDVQVDGQSGQNLSAGGLSGSSLGQFAGGAGFASTGFGGGSVSFGGGGSGLGAVLWK